ncbi:MAG TPA: PA2169 family four-helix-bundle protein [Edaphobacter sp.]|nr:PA2169 family four-helix-bundle protein [Edaphobacter sp.]
MSTDDGKRNEMRRALMSVINILVDSQKEFTEIGDRLKDETVKRYLLAESLKRAQFRGDLEEVLHQNGVHDIKESGTAAGTLSRVWGDLKAKLGGGDHAILASAEEGEDAVREVYADALKQDLPLPVRQTLAEQQAHILDSHDYLKNHRDALASK